LPKPRKLRTMNVRGRLCYPRSHKKKRSGPGDLL
jgi:hypothetical protein